MKKLFLLFSLISVSTLAQAQNANNQTRPFLQSLENWQQAVETTATPSGARSLANTSNYRSRWSRRQAVYQHLSGRSVLTSDQTKSPQYFGYRMSRQVREVAEDTLPRRTMSRRSRMGASSAKARLLQRSSLSQEYRDSLKPRRFKDRSTTEATSVSSRETYRPLDSILQELEADFDIEIKAQP